MLHGTTSDPLQTDFGNKTTINSSKDGIKGALNSESDNGGNKQIELSLDVRSCESCHVICQSDSGKHENGIFVDFKTFVEEHVFNKERLFLKIDLLMLKPHNTYRLLV